MTFTKNNSASPGKPTRVSVNPTLDSPTFETTLESLWSELLDQEKAFIVIFPFFDTYKEAAMFLGNTPQWYTWKYSSREYFRQAMKVRMTTSHDAAMSLLKQDIAAKALGALSRDIYHNKVDAKELRSMIKTMTGKVRESTGPSRHGNMVDLTSVKTWRDDEDDEVG